MVWLQFAIPTLVCLILVDGDRSVVSYDQVDFSLPLVQGPICQVIAYGIQAPAPPFPVFVLALVLNGFGLAIQVRILRW